MGILKRFTDIMKANVNSVLERAEGKNADKLLEQYLRDARKDYEEVKAETAGIIADEMAAARKVADLEEEIAKLSKYARQAVAAGNDDDARKFLEAKARASASKAEADTLYAQAKVNSDRMREMTKKLGADIAAAEGKLAELKSKLAVAEQTEKMNELSAKLGTMSHDAGLSAYDSLADAVQKRIDAADAKAQLTRELDADLGLDSLKEKYDVSSSDGDDSIEDELAALKAQLGK